VVDDEPALLRLVQEMLRPRAIKVLVAPRPSEALRICETQAIDLLISDVRMPEIDGNKLADRRVSRLGPGLAARLELGAPGPHLAGNRETAGMVGHDIRNPLQSMIGEIYLLKQFLTNMPESPTKNEVDESLQAMDENIAYINKIVADLQDYSRKLTPDYNNINLSESINNVVQGISIPDNINLVVNAMVSITMKTDPVFLRRALTNLINNAIQAMPSGGTLTIRVYEKDDKAFIEVADTGTGIPEEVKSRLFTPMMTTKAKGQGLGLAVTKRLVEALGGTITFESTIGKGTNFILGLPTQGT
jgi:signal transduction histidine kinase